jgi:hypothetical protein
MPNNTKTLWGILKIAKNLNAKNFPEKMSYSGEWTEPDKLPEVFAKIFKTKVDDIMNETE